MVILFCGLTAGGRSENIGYRLLFFRTTVKKKPPVVKGGSGLMAHDRFGIEAITLDAVGRQ